MQPPSSSGRSSETDPVNSLLHFHVPSLAHLQALISHPPPGFPPQTTGLIVIDDLATLFTAEFKPVLPAAGEKSKSKHPNPADRLRWRLVGSLLSRLRRLGLQLDAATLVINGMGSRFRDGRPPMLHPGLSGWTWESGLAGRVVLMYVWVPGRQRGKIGGMKRVRVAEAVRQGMGKRAVMPFVVLQV